MDKLRALHYTKREINSMKEDIRTSLVSSIDDVLSDAFVDFLDPELSDHYNSEYPVSYKPHEIKVFGKVVPVLCFGFPFGAKYDLHEMVLIPTYDFMFVTHLTREDIKAVKHLSSCLSSCDYGSELAEVFVSRLSSKIFDFEGLTHLFQACESEAQRIMQFVLQIYEDGDLM